MPYSEELAGCVRAALEAMGFTVLTGS